MMRIQYWNFCFLLLAFVCAGPLSAEQEYEHEQAGKPAQEQHDDHQGEEAHEDEQGNGHDDEHEDAHDEDGGGHEEEESRVHLTEEQRRAAGIVVEALLARNIPTEIEAPGEIRLNAYATSQVTPRIEAQVLERHARLGDAVSEGQALATLSSVSMAEAQGALLVAAKEWQRVKEMGKKVVSERRYMEAEVAFQQAQAKLLAYGMSTRQVRELINKNDISRANGRFTLLSPQNGTVIRDDFVIGQMLEPGQVLFEVTDESKLWIEARTNPEAVSALEIGASARILSGQEWSGGKIIQIYHALDESTRTLAVRLEIPNPDDRLHPGQFVTVYMHSGEADKAVPALPLDAVVRAPDGDWQVFVEAEPGEFEPKEVELLRQVAGLAVVEGLEIGTRVVTQGAFFVQSELAKSGFDVHNH